MRWRLSIFLLSATAAFCFILLTSVTDYGSGTRRQSPLVSATLDKATNLASAILPAQPEPPAAPVREVRANRDFFADPASMRVFVPLDADPVMARIEAERETRAARGKPENRNKLKWDEHGWYREEVALTTAYCPCPACCGPRARGITSTGTTAWVPGLAADPIYLAYGTKVFVPGYGVSVIDDTGGAMRRHWRQNGILHIDVRLTYHYEARQWGKQYLRVKIYEDE